MGLIGQTEFQKVLKRIDAGAAKAARRTLKVGSQMIRGEAFQSISRGSASGKSGGKHQHVPSKPGEPPNREEGFLQAFIEDRVTGPLEAEVTSSAPYAADLEFGTSKMEARPYMRPARDKKEPEVQRLFEHEMLKVVIRS